MKKVLFILPLLFLSSCGNNTSSSTYVISVNNNGSSSERPTCYLSVRQVYEEVYESNQWGNVRSDRRFYFYYNQEICLENLKYSLKPEYECKGNSYRYEFFVYDYLDLTTKVPKTFYLTKNTIIY